MKDFIKEILEKHFGKVNFLTIYEKSPLLQYINLKTSAIYSNTKSRRSLANLYAIYAILYFYARDFYGDKESYRAFEGYEYTKLFRFYRSLYGGEKLQNHALNSRVNGEFKNKKVRERDNDLIIINNRKYLLHLEYLYIDSLDIAKVALEIIEKYIALLQEKDSHLIILLESLTKCKDNNKKKEVIKKLLMQDCEARIFEIISYAILKNHYKNEKIYIGKSRNDIEERYLELYKTGRTNANDGGIDFVMRPLGRFFQVTEVNSYDKYLLDIDKVLHFPITFVIKTTLSRIDVLQDLQEYINKKSQGMKIIKDRYINAIEEIITINELIEWLDGLDNNSTDLLIKDIDLYYRLELNLLHNEEVNTT